MSIKVMTRVWEHSQHGGGTLLVLLALADYANDNGVCWPDVATLATKARLTDRQVSNVLKDLIKAGDLAMVQGRGRGKHSAYAVLVGLTEEQQEKVKNFLRNNFGEIKTVKNDASKRGNLRQEKGKFDAFSDADLPQQDAPNPDPIRHDPSENRQRERKTNKKQAHAPAVQAYFDAYPNETLDADQIADITRTVTDMPRWRDVLRYWKGNGHRARSVLKMLDRYSSGASIADERPGGNRTQQIARPPPDLPMITAATNSTKRIPTADERRRIIEATQAKAHDEHS